jgi:drug/metabolite transporter (DMT)-like permease
MIGLGEAFSVACALAWAIGVIIYKRLGEQVPPLKLGLLKNLIVLALVVPTVALLASPAAVWLGFQRLSLPTFDTATALIILASGVIGIAVADTLYLRALNALGAGRMGVIGNFYSPFVIVLSILFLGERLSSLQIAGFVLVMIGILLVNAPDTRNPIDIRSLRAGVLTGIASIALMAVAIVMVKRILETESFWWVVLLRVAGAVTGLVLLFALSPTLRRTFRGPAQPIRWGPLFIAAFVGQYLSMTLWLAGYKYTSASVASVLNETASIFIVVFAALFLGEALGQRRIFGVMITLSGVVCMVI